MLKKFALSLMILLSLCGISFADFIYTTESGTLGTIRTNESFDVEAPSIQYRGNMSSAFVTSFWNGKTSNVLLVDRYGSLSGDRGYVFNPSDLSTFTASYDIAGVYGTELAAFSLNGYSLYLTAGSEIYDVNTYDFKVINSFDCTNVISRDDHDTQIRSIAVDTSIIHVLVNVGEQSKYLRFDGQLKKNGVKYFRSFDVSPGASVVLSTNNNLAAVGHSLGIDMLNSNSKFYRLISTDHPVKAICPDTSGGLFYATQTTSGDKYTNTIRHYSTSEPGSNQSTQTIESSSPNIKLLRDTARLDIFAAMTDEKITVFSYIDGMITTWEFTSSDLGGNPVAITAASVKGYSSSSSSSGCSSVYAGLVMIAVIPFMLRKR